MPHPFFLFLFVFSCNKVGGGFLHHHRWCLSEMITRVMKSLGLLPIWPYQIGRGHVTLEGKKRGEKKGEHLPIKRNHLCQCHLIPKQLNMKGTTTRYPKYLASFNTFVLNNEFNF